MAQTDERTFSLGSGLSVVTSGNFTFGHDAVLLAYFSKPKNGMKVCDFGTGCGIISLLLCRGCAGLSIDAVEIQPEAAALAQKSVEISSLCGKINVINDDFLECGGLVKNSYDLIVCNPPYKKAGTGRVSASPEQRAARHEGSVTPDSAAQRAYELLKDGGKFCVCHRPERLAELIVAMAGRRLEPKRVRFVQQRAGASPWLVLCEGRKNSKPGLIVEPPLILESENGAITDELKSIYGEY